MPATPNNNPSIEQRELLDAHLRLVLEANKRLNLTRITTWEEAQVLHVEDSLAGLPYVEQAPDGPYADMGSGAGYPGIPLAIATGRPTTLIESVGKKAAALQHMLSELGLREQVSVYSGRIEELAVEQPERFSVITARALSSLPSLLELAAPLLAIGGLLICYKGAPEESEIQQALAIQDRLGLSHIQTAEYSLTNQPANRSLYIFQKIATPTIPLPRRTGQAQNHPLK